MKSAGWRRGHLRLIYAPIGRLGNDLDALLNGLEGLGEGSGAGSVDVGGDTEGHHGGAVPRLGGVEELLDGVGLGLAEAAVVLERGSDALSGKSGPDDELGHAGGVLREDGHGTTDSGDHLDKGVDGGLVLEEDDSAVAGLVGVLELALVSGNVLRRLEDRLVGGPDGVPELLVLVAEDKDGAGGLGVERRGGELDGAFDDLLELLVGDGDLVGKVVVGAAGLGVLDNGEGFVSGDRDKAT